MKKLFSLIMIVCMMAGAVALGEEGFAVKNEHPRRLLRR